MRYLIAAAALALLGSASQCAATSIQVVPTSTLVLINKDKGDKLVLNKGDTDIDQPTQFDCPSTTGCVVSMDATIGILASDSRWKICFRIDGAAIKPKCAYQANGRPIENNSGSELGSAEVTIGTHTVQTYVNVRVYKEGVAPRLKEWEVHYAVYGE